MSDSKRTTGNAVLHAQLAAALLRKRDILALTGWSNSTLYNRIAAGTFPRQVRTGPRTVAWLQQEVLAYIDKQVAERNSAISAAAIAAVVTVK